MWEKYWWLRNCGIRTYWMGLRRSSRPHYTGCVHREKFNESNNAHTAAHVRNTRYVQLQGGGKVKLGGALESVWWDKKPAVDFVMEMSWCHKYGRILLTLRTSNREIAARAEPSPTWSSTTQRLCEWYSNHSFRQLNSERNRIWRQSSATWRSTYW